MAAVISTWVFSEHGKGAGASPATLSSRGFSPAPRGADTAGTPQRLPGLSWDGGAGARSQMCPRGCSSRAEQGCPGTTTHLQEKQMKYSKTSSSRGPEGQESFTFSRNTTKGKGKEPERAGGPGCLWLCWCCRQGWAARCEGGSERGTEQLQGLPATEPPCSRCWPGILQAAWPCPHPACGPSAESALL